MENKLRQIKSYGRTVAKALSENQKNDLINYVNNFDFDTFKNNYKKFILEIGFGNGENILKLATENEEYGIVGVDPFKNSCIKVIRDIQKLFIKNMCIFNDDVKNLDRLFGEKFFEKAYILFPDPWPKKKHNKRRLINEDFFKWLVTKVFGEIIFATDNLDYFESVLEFASKYVNVKRIEDGDQLIANTKYKQKAIAEGRKCNYAVFCV